MQAAVVLGQVLGKKVSPHLFIYPSKYFASKRNKDQGKQEIRKGKNSICSLCFGIMENVPIGYRLSKTMDVLMKFEKVPPGLKVTAQETVSNLIIRALWKNQIHSEASPTSGKFN